MHAPQADAPTLAWNWPAAQFTQTVELAVAAIVPAEQLEHAVAPAAEYLPEVHATHAVDADAPTEPDTVPATQLKHAVAPATVWYWPPGHEVHAVWPVNGWNVPTAHSEHADADAAE